jgi:hypothetical protein
MNIVEAIKEAQRQMLNETGVDALAAKIKSYPARIREQHQTVEVLSDQFDIVKGNLQQAESILMAEISAGVNEAGKPKFSNDTLRKAEFMKRNQTEPDYQEALRQYKAVEESLRAAKFDLQQLQDEFRADCVTGNMMAAKLGLLA